MPQTAWAWVWMINGPQMPARGGESGLLQEPQLVTLFSWVHQLYL